MFPHIINSRCKVKGFTRIGDPAPGRRGPLGDPAPGRRGVRETRTPSGARNACATPSPTIIDRAISLCYIANRIFVRSYIED